jgi:hypothetical protein
MLRLMGLVAPAESAGTLARVRGIFILIAIVIALLLIGFGLAKLVALPFGGVGTGGGILLGLVIVAAALGALAFFGRRRQSRMQAERRAGAG